MPNKNLILMERKLQETLIFRGRLFDSEGGGCWQIWSGQIIYLQCELGRKGQNIYFLPQQNFEKS